MITSVRIKKFGRFENKEFNLKKETVFLGKNESGKTTLFDAITFALCRPRGNSSAGRAITDRYEKPAEDSVKILTDPAGFSVPEDEFLNLNTIKAGSIHFPEISNSSNSWFKKVESELFAGGISPDRILRSLDAQRSNSGNYSHIKEKNQLQIKAQSLSDAIKKMRSEKDQLRRAAAETEERLKKTESLEVELHSLMSEIKKKEEELNQLKKISRRIQTEEEYHSLISLKEKIEDFFSRRSAVIPIAEAEDFHGKIQEAEKTVASAASLLQLKKNEETEKRKKTESREAELESLKAVYQNAALMTDRVNQAKSDPPKKIIRTRNPKKFYTGLLLTASGLLSGLAAFIIFHDFSNAFFITAAAALAAASAGTVLILNAYSSVEVPDSEKQMGILNKLYEEWNLKNPSHPLTQVNSFEGFQSFLSDLQMDYKAKQQKLGEIKEDLRKNGESVREISETLEQENRKLISLRNDFQLFLQKHSAKDLGELYFRKQEQQDAENFLKHSLNDLLGYPLSDGTISMETLQTAALKVQEKIRETERILAASDREGISFADSDVPRKVQLEKIRNRIQSAESAFRDLQSKTGALKDEIQKNQLINTRDTAQIEVNLSNISGNLLQSEKELSMINNRIQEIENNIRAAALAYEIFSEIRSDADTGLQLLAEAVAERFGKFFSDSEKRSIVLKKLTDRKASGSSDIQIMDATGNLRSLDHLSQGTKDTFLFAVRLVLSEKAARNAKRILILDDPFLSLDTDRQARAMEILKEFTGKTGWQVILLTLSETTAELFEKTFPDYAKIHL